MRILITGNMGYIGPVLVKELRSTFPNLELIGFDTGYFGHCLTNPDLLPESKLDTQYFGDLRNFPYSLLSDVDAVIHLASISNDPMGKQFEKATSSINYKAGAKLAKKSIEYGVKRFIFASSCSMYGKANNDQKKETDEIKPLTSYARSKVLLENYLSELNLNKSIVTSLRFSTACGMSDRLRLDLVLNDFVACAISSKEITVLSDGKPWRPLIDVKDMSRAIIWSLVREQSDGGQYLAINIGSDQWNYQVEDLAHAVAKALPGTNVSINRNALPDNRSYRVNFSLFKKVAPDHQPKCTLESSINDLIEGMQNIKFNNKDFRSSEYMRLEVLRRHIINGRLTKDLFWAN